MELLITFLEYLLTVYTLCVLAWALMSWLPMISPSLAYNSTVTAIRRFLDSVVEPYVRLFRFVPPIRAGGAMIDLSALVAILVLVILGPELIILLRGLLLG